MPRSPTTTSASAAARISDLERASRSILGAMTREGRVSALSIFIAVVLPASACTSTNDAAPTGVSCKTDERGCACTIGAPTADTCGASKVAGALCCAATGWPREGTCDCTPVTCIDDGVQCRCGRGVGGPLAACSGAICCQTAGGDCYCRRAAGGQQAKCDATDTPSAFCGPTAGTRCPSPSMKVDTCS